MIIGHLSHIMSEIALDIWEQKIILMEKQFVCFGGQVKFLYLLVANPCSARNDSGVHRSLCSGQSV